MKNAEAINTFIEIMKELGNGKSLTKLRIIKALAMSIDVLTEQEKTIRGGSK
jgi:hypothetical protein